MAAVATVSVRGARRWEHGHPWIYRSDVTTRPTVGPGAVLVRDGRRRVLGWALWSPASEISLRLLDRNPEASIDAEWWREQMHRAIHRRRDLAKTTTAMRLIHGEADGCPSLICDRYDRYLVLQFMSAGLESFRDGIVAGLRDLLRPEGILARNDVPLRRKEQLPLAVETLFGSVPAEVEIVEHGIRFLAAPWRGQKTGAFLDQRENRAFIGGLTREGGRALDCFSYHGSFALHLARRAGQVIALDSSAEALQRAKENCARNGVSNVTLVETDAFDYLRARDTAGDRFDTIVLDPPPFAKTRAALGSAVRGYKEINLRALRLLSPGGLLFTASCSFHLSKALFFDVLAAAASDSGRRVALRALTCQPLDHPEVLTIPETGYLKGALLEALE